MQSQSATKALPPLGAYLFQQKRIRFPDVVYGYIKLPSMLKNFIDTPEFQRLRNLCQLGTLRYKYPNAVHTRYEHCVGTSGNAGDWIRHLKEKSDEALHEFSMLAQSPNPNHELLECLRARIAHINEEDIMLVQIAGLCHDLGHGPFSHCFEHLVNGLGIEWHHEDISCALLKRINNRIKILSESQRKRVKCMIKGKVDKTDTGRPFLYDIVSNSKNGIDADKFDYLSRDCLMTQSEPAAFNYKSVIEASRIENGEICYAAKYAPCLHQLVRHRFNMYAMVYTCWTTRAVELMVQHAIYLAEDGLHLIECARNRDVDAFLSYTDGIIPEIKRRRNEDEFKHAAIILDRIDTRDLYKFVGVIIKPNNYEGDLEADVKRHLQEKGLGEVAMTNKRQFDYGMGKSNPMEKIPFYSHENKLSTLGNYNLDIDRVMPTVCRQEEIGIFSILNESTANIDMAMQEWRNGDARYESYYNAHN
ncbi:HD domain containing protein [Acanthamoeba castellanii str. Neff]|uniref:HD domain containing protein n=1 Tax=Acanthamoeba castellanii (strain ATCC 30010 / Neff) TaxID=1257118 RepID=L8GHU2_ACACF|nr:HD domain containing protein [Acanthamoeba castellanii str. Neff]ELR12429.1 HD domain containing protein [Acanthamoeba castellanii str. Neff]